MNHIVKTHTIVPTICNMLLVFRRAAFVDTASLRFMGINCVSIISIWLFIFGVRGLSRCASAQGSPRPVDTELFNVFLRSFSARYIAWRIPQAFPNFFVHSWERCQIPDHPNRRTASSLDLSLFHCYYASRSQVWDTVDHTASEMSWSLVVVWICVLVSLAHVCSSGGGLFRTVNLVNPTQDPDSCRSPSTPIIVGFVPYLISRVKVCRWKKGNDSSRRHKQFVPVHNMMSLSEASWNVPKNMFRFHSVLLLFCDVRSLIVFSGNTSTDIFDQIRINSCQRNNDSDHVLGICIEPLGTWKYWFVLTRLELILFSVHLLTWTSEGASFVKSSACATSQYPKGHYWPTERSVVSSFVKEFYPHADTS